MALRLIREVMSPSRGIIKKTSMLSDRITGLDDDVLGHILSYLPTKDVMRTCILSKDWKYKWTLSSNVDISDDSSSVQHQNVEAFVKYVDRILLMSQSLKSFRLTCGNLYGLCDVQRWISTANKHALECFVVKCDVEGTVFPGTLLNSTSLEELHLENGCMLNISTKSCARHLHSLDLYNVEIIKENLDNVTLTFPVLDKFSAHRCKWLGFKSVEIDAPSLTEFTSWASNGQPNDISLKILAPKLATFVCLFGLREKFVLSGSSSPVSAYLLLCDSDQVNLELAIDDGAHVRRLINEFTNLEQLFLASAVSEIGHPLNRLHKLRKLTMFAPMNAIVVFELLHAAPSLCFLIINGFDWPDYDYAAVEFVPPCITYCLKELEFYDFEPNEASQLDLAKFLLKNGKLLRRFLIQIDLLSGPNYNFKEKIEAFPRASSCITFDVHDD